MDGKTIRVLPQGGFVCIGIYLKLTSQSTVEHGSFARIGVDASILGERFPRQVGIDEMNIPSD
jgi:hypothetical protein